MKLGLNNNLDRIIISWWKRPSLPKVEARQQRASLILSSSLSSTGWAKKKTQLKFRQGKTAAVSKWTPDLSLQKIWIQTGSRVTHQPVIYRPLHSAQRWLEESRRTALSSFFCNDLGTLLQVKARGLKKTEEKADIVFVWFSNVTGILWTRANTH